MALKLAGITRDTPAPPGGEIVKDPATGEPTGILKDTAMDLVYAKVPEPSFAEKLEAAEASLRHAAANGVTSVHEMADAASFEVFEELARRGRLTTRVHVYVPITEVETVARLKLKSPFGGPYLKLAGLKGFVDGSLGSATAYFFEPYTDEPGTSGLLHGQMFPEGIMEKRILEADRAGLQLAIHAIGDRAVSLLLDMYEKAVAANGPRDRRWRVEHAQHLRPADIARFGKLGPRRRRPALPRHRRRPLGRKEDRAGARQDDLRLRVPAPGRGRPGLRLGLDGRAARAHPGHLRGGDAADARRAEPGRLGARGEGLRRGGRPGLHRQRGLGRSSPRRRRARSRPGKLADLVVLDRDIFAIPPEGIGEARVRMTVFDGRIVYGTDR
ncbi:MAG: amidohydrolase family protein [Candidatus Moduliflexus flocculans]|nr:amidohydrolase family protein [Candidatus Moduliflexus flocculans]